MFYSGSVSPPREPTKKKYIIPKRRQPEKKMGDDDASSSAGKTAVPVGSLMWPMLDRSNYSEWAMLMQCNLEAMEVWDVVEQGGKGVKRARDRLAMSTLLRSVPKEMWTTLGVKKTVKEAWDAVKSMR
jgi:hypothetical protein